MADMVSDEISDFRHKNRDTRSFEVISATHNKQLTLLSYTLKPEPYIPNLFTKVFSLTMFRDFSSLFHLRS